LSNITTQKINGALGVRLSDDYLLLMCSWAIRFLFIYFFISWLLVCI